LHIFLPEKLNIIITGITGFMEKLVYAGKIGNLLRVTGVPANPTEDKSHQF
jgi:hypothetical protein